MEVIETQPEIDYVKIGQRIRAARLEKGYSQADLGALVGCSNNHMSHVEVGQTKAEFFNDTDVLVSMTEEEKNMLSQWNLLTPAQRAAVINIIGLLLSSD